VCAAEGGADAFSKTQKINKKIKIKIKNKNKKCFLCFSAPAREACCSQQQRRSLHS